MLLSFAPTVRAQFPSRLNLSLVGQHEPPEAATGYGDVWGDGDLACLGTWTAYASFGLGIYSLTNPAAPHLLKVYNFSNTVANRFEQGVIRSNILYVGSWGGNGNGSGLHIYSLTNPAVPAPLSRITATAAGTVLNGFNDVHTLFLERNFLYEAAHNFGSVSVKVFNVVNPAAPVYVRDIITTNTTKVHQMTVRNKGGQVLLFTSGWGGNDNGEPASPGQTDIWDVTQVGTQPAQWLGRIYSGYNSHSSWPTPDGNTLIVCRELTGGEVKFYDIANPATIPANAAPFVTLTPASMGIEADIPHNPVVVSNLLFLSWYQNGLQVFDITDRTNPVRVGYFDTFPGAKSASFQGNWGVYPWLGIDRILLSDIQSGLFVLNGTALLTPTNNYPPLVVRSPMSLNVTQGFTANFAPGITGSVPKYQWQFNGAPLANATNATLTLNNVQTNHAGNYVVRATNNSGAVTSAVAVLSVVVPNTTPIISSQPPNLAVYPDNPAMFTVGVVGAAPFGFQWRFNGTPIPGATNQSFTRDPALPEHVGYYSVVVSNAFGTAVSSKALLTLLDSPYLSGVTAVAGARSALISWNTTLPADSQVEYEATTTSIPSPNSPGAAAQGNFGSASYIDMRNTTNHLILLTGLAPGTRYSFQTLATAGTNTYVSGVYQFTTAGTNIVDNPHATFAGTWTIGTASVDKYATNYAFATSSAGAPTATATFSPNLTTPGQYDVAVWYPQGGNRANNAPYTINFNGGSLAVPVNQQSGGGAWQTIGSGIEFAGGSGNVTLANNANPIVVLADAVRFAYVEAQDFPAGATMPTWWRNYFFGGPANPDADADGDGFSNAQEYLTGTSPTDASSSLRVVAQTDATAARVTFWPYLGNRSYQLLVRTNINDVNWQAYQPANIQATPFGHGIFTVPVTNAARSFFRVQVQWAPNQSVARSVQAARGTSREFDAACGPYRVFVRPIGDSL
jgi:choice-of-anchor B domain-containing protein